MKKISDEAFFWSIKLVCVGALAILALGLAFSAHAATPVAVWDGDFKTTAKGGYTLDANGNTVAEDGSTITIGNTGGIKISFSQIENITVIYKYSDLSLGKEQAIATFKSTHSESHVTNGNAVGVELTADNKTHGMWEGAQYGSDGSTVSATSGKFAITYKPTEVGGTYLYTIANGSLTQVYGLEGLRSYKYKPEGVNVGGKDAGLPATDMKISAIAIFNGILSEAEMKAYVFPSELPLSKMYSNRLSTGEAVVTPGEYGAITVPGFGYNATAFSAATQLSDTASGEEITGSYANIMTEVSGDTDTRVHTIAGWFKMDALPTSSGVANAKTLFVAKTGEHDTYAGYKVAVDSDGKIYIGQCDNEAWRDNQVSTTDNLVKAGEWFHLAIACSGRTDGNRNSSAAFFFNGNKVSSTDTKFKTNLNGNNCTIVRIGTKDVTEGLGISAAGVYVDNNAIVNPARIVEAATNFVVAADYHLSATISGDADFDKIQWTQGAFVPDSAVTITVEGEASAGEVAITFNTPSVQIKTLKIISSRDVKLVAESPLTNVASFDWTLCSGLKTLAWPVSALAMTDANIFYGAGAGSEEAHASITFAADKSLNLRGETPFYIGTTALDDSPAYTMTFKDASVYCTGWSGLAVGQATVTVEGSSAVSTERVILSQGREGLTSALVVKGTASVTSTGTTDEDSNQNSVMFGHWNGPSTFTLQDSASFTSASQVLVGKTGNNQTINIAGGVFTAKGIKAASNATGSNAINLSGGKLVLGEVGITSYSSTTISVNVTGNATIEASTNMAITQPVSLGSGAALTCAVPANKVMTALGVISGSGKLVKTGEGQVVLSGDNRNHSGGTTIEEGVLALGNNSALGTGTVTVKEDAQLDLNGKTVTATFAGNGTICNSSGTKAYVNGIQVNQGDELTLKDGKIYFYLAEGETLTLTSIPAANKVLIGGEGRVEFASETVPTLPAGLWAEDWTGTFAWSGFNGEVKNWNPTTYYNGTNSVFEFSGTITSGWFWQPTVAKNPFGELVLKGDITFTDGHTHPSVEKSAISQYCFTRLSGTKAWTIETSSEASSGIVIGDMSGFTGSFTVKSTNGNGGYRIVVGDGELSVDIDSLTKAAFHFTGNATLASTSLVASRGYFVRSYATLTMAGYPIFYSTTLTFAENAALCLMDHNCKATCHYGVTIAAGVTIPVTVIDAKGLTAGESLIIWNATPEGDFALNVGPGIAKGTPGLVASKTDAGLIAAADDTKTFFEVGDTAAAERPTTIFENAWLDAAGITGTVDEKQTKLDTPNDAGITPGQAYLAGFAADEVKNAAVTINIALLPDTGKVRIHATGLPPIYERRNNAVITYALLQTADVTDWTSATRTDMGVDTTVDVDLTEDEQQFYRVSAEIELSTGSSEIIAVVPSVNVVASGMPLLTEPGTQFAASLGSATLDAPTDTLTFQLAGAGVTEGQTYHLEVHEQQANGAPAVYGVVAHVLSDKTVTFDFGHAVAANTTVKLTLISDSGAANGNVCAVSTVQPTTSTFAADTIVSARMGLLPYDDGIATMASPKMPQQYRIPAIATDGNGEVIACFDCRYGKSDLGATWDSGNGDGWVFSGIDIAENYSSDNGRTFGETHLAVDVGNMRDQTGAWVGGYDNRCNSAYIVKDRDIGDVCVLFDPAGNGGDGLYWMMGLTGGGLSTVGTATEKTDVVLYTRKRGKDSKWENRRSVKWEILGSLGVTTATVGLGFLEGPGHGIVTTKACTIKGENVPAGTLVFPIQVFTSGSVWRSEAGAAYSTDGGKTWKTTALTTDKDNGSPQENCIMELDDGTWYMCTKCNVAGYYRTYRYNHSTDAWVKVENGAPCPSARQGSCLRMGVGADGRGRYAICHARNDRANVVVYFGKDVSSPGETPSTTNRGIQWDWDNYITLHKENTSGGYSSMCMVDDTTLGILYETNYGAGTDGGNDPSGCRMYFTRIDVSDKVVAP